MVGGEEEKEEEESARGHKRADNPSENTIHFAVVSLVSRGDLAMAVADCRGRVGNIRPSYSGSNPGPEICHSTVVANLLSTSTQIPGQHLKPKHDRYFPHPFLPFAAIRSSVRYCWRA